MAEIYAAFASGKKRDLPQHYSDLTANFCGTSVVQLLQADWPKIPLSLQPPLSALFTRPIMTQYKDFPELFHRPPRGIRVHYNDTGALQVPTYYVDLVGNSAMTALFHDYVDNLHFRAPASDSDRGGMNAKNISMYDIYIILGPDDPAEGEAIDEGGGASFIEIAANLADPKCTVAHELFHAVQFTYGPILLPWAELTANWAAAVAFPETEATGSARFAPQFFRCPNTYLLSSSSPCGLNFEYGAYVWGMFLTQRYDDSLIRNEMEIAQGIIDTFPNLYDVTLAATDSSLKLRGSALEDAFKEFTVWNYFTGSRYNLAPASLRYTGGANYPMVPCSTVDTFPDVDTIRTVDYLGAKYVRYVPPACRLHARFDLSFSISAGWRNTLLVFPADGGLDTAFTTFTGDTGYVSVPTAGGLDGIVSIPACVRADARRPITNAGYARLRGDLNNDCNVSPADLVSLIYLVCCCIPPASAPPPEMADVNCDGNVNLDDVIYLVNYVYLGQSTVCALTDPPCCPSAPDSCK